MIAELANSAIMLPRLGWPPRCLVHKLPCETAARRHDIWSLTTMWLRGAPPRQARLGLPARA